MRDTTATLATLMARYSANGIIPAPAALVATFGIDDLDLPILVLDIEDEFGIEFGEDWIRETTTLAEMARIVEAEIADRAQRPRKSLVPISCRPWMERAAA